jgi:hypothetical protein
MIVDMFGLFYYNICMYVEGYHLVFLLHIYTL